MKLFVTNKALGERDRLTRIEAILDSHDARMQAHEEDCIRIREETKEEIVKLGAAIRLNHDDWRGLVGSHHAENIKRAEDVIKRQRWQIGIMITTSLAVAGFLAEQVWARIFIH